MDPDVTGDQPLLSSLEVEYQRTPPRRCTQILQGWFLCFLKRFHSSMRNWWNNSTDPKILGSPLSRRVALVWVVPVGYLLFLVLHITSSIDGRQILLLDVGALLVSSAILRFSCISSLKTDVLLALILALWGISSEYLLFSSSAWYAGKGDNQNGGAQFFVAHVVGFRIMFLQVFFIISFFAGLHSSACLVGMILHWFFQLCIFAIFPLVSFVFISACFIAGAMFEHFLARAVLLQESHRRLLENGSHGTCSMDITSGLVTDSCPRFIDLIGIGEQALGISLYDCVACADHCRIEQLIDSVQRGEFTPQLVTWKTRCEDRMFDVKIIPINVVSRTLQLCIQVQGEARELQGRKVRLFDPDELNNETDNVDAARTVDSTGGTPPDCILAMGGSLRAPRDAVSLLERQSAGNDADRLTSISAELMNPRLGVWREDGSVSSQSSRQTVHSFWDAMRMLIGREVRPESMICQYLSRIPEITQDYDEMLWDLLAEDDVHSPGDLLNRLQERVQDDSPPPISAEQWARASFRVADRVFAASISQGIERSRRREQAASCLSAAVLNRQPIEQLPVEATYLIAAAMGEAGRPPPPEDGTMIMTGFFNWFQSLHHELHPGEPDLTQEELNEYWNSFALQEIA